MNESKDEFRSDRIRLTPTERRLLEAIQSRPGHIFSRKELVDTIMSDNLVLPRTIDVHIRALRKKLGRACRIRTIRGEGYMWEA